MARKRPPLESKVQADLIKDLKDRFPGCWVLKQDTDYQQGIPDLIVLWNDRWAMLEVKREEPTSEDDFEPNQEWYIDLADRMSFGACVYPENKEEVLNALSRSFQAGRLPRVSKRQQVPLDQLRP